MYWPLHLHPSFLAQSFWNPCKFPGDKSTQNIFCSNWVGFGMAPGLWVVTRKTTSWLEAWKFQLHPPFSREEKGAENGVNNWSCLHEETPIKFQQYGVQGAFSLVNTSHARTFMQPNSTGTEAPVLGTLPDLTLCIFSSGCSSVSFILSFNKLVHKCKLVFPEFCFSK